LGRLGSSVVYFSTTGSTNDVASMLATSGNAEGAVVVADAQTAGRGRRGRHWFSPPLSGLYVSVVLSPSRAHAEGDRATALLTLAAGVALAESVQAVTGLRADIKWPNDLLVQRRKLAGILAEGIHAPMPRRVGSGADPAAGRSAVRSVILGYGINVGSMAYPPDLADRATSLESELGRPIDRAELCVETLAAVARRYDDLLEGRFDAILDAWRERAPGSCGGRVTWAASSGVQSGITAGIDADGALLVTVGDRVERIVAGEVSWA
jgi:BirA family biotin operon repressor/biotin-[acetyl-CoA-carboxylase] ligase